MNLDLFEAEKPARPKPTGIASFESPARFLERSSNRKLSPVDVTPARGRRAAITPRPPYCSSTYASIDATCSTRCPLKGSGCYAQAGYTGLVNRRMDEAAAGLSELDVAREEARLIDESFGGGLVPDDGAGGRRALRLHVGGDARTVAAVELLAAAAVRWIERGGGSVWTYTHSWREVPRRSWGPVSVLASVEAPEEIEEALLRGYAAAVVVDRFPRGHRVFSLPGTSARVVPCPAETARVTCVECRLCLGRDLLGRGLAIGFSVHGGEADAAKRVLRVARGIPEPQTSFCY